GMEVLADVRWANRIADAVVVTSQSPAGLSAVGFHTRVRGCAVWVDAQGLLPVARESGERVLDGRESLLDAFSDEWDQQARMEHERVLNHYAKPLPFQIAVESLAQKYLDLAVGANSVGRFTGDVVQRISQ